MNSGTETPNGRAPLDATLEGQLRAFAAGALSAREERSLGWRLAGDAPALARLEAIRRELRTAAARSGVSLAAARARATARADGRTLILERFRAFLTAAHQEGCEAVGVLARVGSQWLAASLGGELPRLVPRAADLATPPPPAAAPTVGAGPDVTRYTASDGTVFVIQPEPRHRFTLEVISPAAAPDAVAKVFRWRGDPANAAFIPTGITGRFDQGNRAILKNCPRGYLRVEIGATSYVLGLDPLEPSAV